MENRRLSQRKSAYELAFEHYLRTGERFTSAQWLERFESKFNQNHDELGRFTFGPGGVAGAQMGHGSAGGRGTQHQTVGASQRRPAGGEVSRPVARSQVAEMPGHPQTGRTAWRSSNDEAFVAAANFYNNKYRLRPGDQGYRTATFLKAWAMRESGGEGSEHAFRTDPFQVNNSGDWADEKTEIAGLRRDEKMTPAKSAYAALEWLRHKAAIRDGRRQVIGFRNDLQALERYNASPVIVAGGVPRYRWYAQSILEMTNQASKR